MIRGFLKPILSRTFLSCLWRNFCLFEITYYWLLFGGNCSNGVASEVRWKGFENSWKTNTSDEERIAFRLLKAFRASFSSSMESFLD